MYDRNNKDQQKHLVKRINSGPKYVNKQSTAASPLPSPHPKPETPPSPSVPGCPLFSPHSAFPWLCSPAPHTDQRFCHHHFYPVLLWTGPAVGAGHPQTACSHWDQGSFPPRTQLCIFPTSLVSLLSCISLMNLSFDEFLRSHLVLIYQTNGSFFFSFLHFPSMLTPFLCVTGCPSPFLHFFLPLSRVCLCLSADRWGS